MDEIKAPLHRLIYSSRQTPDVALGLDAVVRTIIETSIRKNRAAGLTGLLITIQGFFTQALEGEEAKVRTAYGRICDDRRHGAVTIISAGPVESRLFREWSMCARALTSSDRAILDVIDVKGPFDPGRLTPQSGLLLLTSVAMVQRRAPPFLLD